MLTIGLNHTMLCEKLEHEYCKKSKNGKSSKYFSCYVRRFSNNLVKKVMDNATNCARITRTGKNC